MPSHGTTTEGIPTMAHHLEAAPTASHRDASRRRAITAIRRESRTICPATGKTRYRDRAEARVYQCPEPACHRGLHLTSTRAQRAA